eukprot:11160746-Lingulodinium_polyedra.AAC.1
MHKTPCHELQTLLGSRTGVTGTVVQSCEWTERSRHGNAHVMQRYVPLPKLPPPFLAARPPATGSEERWRELWERN